MICEFLHFAHERKAQSLKLLKRLKLSNVCTKCYVHVLCHLVIDRTFATSNVFFSIEPITAAHIFQFFPHMTVYHYVDMPKYGVIL